LTKHKKIIFRINDNIQSKEDACCSRLDVFDFPQIINYCRIIYLDTDVIVLKKLQPIFHLAKEEKLYALKECENILEFDSEYFGKSLFGSEIYDYRDKSGFNSGVLLFRNCQSIKNLFNIIKVDIKKRKSLMFFYDQPFIIYNAKKLNLSNNVTLINHVAFSHKLSQIDSLEKKLEAIAGGFFLVFRSGAIVFYRRKADITPLKDKLSFVSRLLLRLFQTYFTSPTIIHFSGGVEVNDIKVTAMRQFLSTNVKKKHFCFANPFFFKRLQ
jgi:hypothetical protein